MNMITQFLDWLFGRTLWIPHWTPAKAKQYERTPEREMHYSWARLYMPSARELKWMRRDRERR